MKGLNALKALLNRMRDVHPEDLPASLRDLRSVWIKGGALGASFSMNDQRSEGEQLKDLVALANWFGMYDAADRLKVRIQATAQDWRRLRAFTEKREYVLCAAVWVDTGEKVRGGVGYKYPDTGVVFGGHRHGEAITCTVFWYDLLKSHGEDDKARELRRMTSGEHQGFITSTGRYVNRVEAMHVAFEAGQIPELKDELFSEDLY